MTKNVNRDNILFLRNMASQYGYYEKNHHCRHDRM